MSQFRVFSALFALVLAAGLCGWAYPTLFGDTGLVQVPTADTMPQMNFEVGAHYTNIGSGATTSAAYPIRIDYGIAKGTEVFGLYAPAASSKMYDAMGGGVKINLLSEDSLQTIPGISIGARVVHFSRTMDQNYINVYATSSTTIYRMGDYYTNGYRVRAHVGAEFYRFSGDLTHNFVSGFAGLSFESTKGASIVVDYLPQMADDGVIYRDSSLSAAVRFPFATTFAAEVGMTRPFLNSSSTLYAGFSYHYGEGANYLVRDPLLTSVQTVGY